MSYAVDKVIDEEGELEPWWFGEMNAAWWRYSPIYRVEDGRVGKDERSDVCKREGDAGVEDVWVEKDGGEVGSRVAEGWWRA